ncbi:elongation of very long chain fatty acids protein AAEL008004-like isoform X2 [Anopheles darlingi]|uniref:elongation of very long chain fatty acids protein AAEL008004-like isoform X2 n=1 Tax=Anopheles darlingi TaxID=43151 RepID=UPI0020FFF71A|nr:elongation of very long chain fatty acids protein AAEL008004-like isoform X2 [Anopheles darlingi]
MALVLRNIYETFNYFFTEYKDPRVEQYPLLGSPWPIVTIIIIYLQFVKVWGPETMKNRTPFQLTTLMNVYNLIQIFLNLYIGIVGGLNSYFSDDYSWSCEPINQKGSASRKKLIFVTYLYFISKIIDLLDTVFFVVRKKYNQITFLHTYHHAGMVVATYVFTKFLAGSHATLLGLINSFVHVIMYFYYFLTSFKPELKNSLWWKKHITQVQLSQVYSCIFSCNLQFLCSILVYH